MRTTSTWMPYKRNLLHRARRYVLQHSTCHVTKTTSKTSKWLKFHHFLYKSPGGETWQTQISISRTSTNVSLSKQHSLTKRRAGASKWLNLRNHSLGETLLDQRVLQLWKSMLRSMITTSIPYAQNLLFSRTLNFEDYSISYQIKKFKE